jgi:NADH-quinone oxidoreductase subunit G
LGSELAERILSAAKHVVAIDSLRNRTTPRAHYVLPAATFAEADGTFVNNEARGQRFFNVFMPDGPVQDGWRWIRDLMRASGDTEAEEWCHLDNVIANLAQEMPAFSVVPDIAPPADFRIVGRKIPRQSIRYSGRTAMHANANVNEPAPPADPDSPLSFSMEGYEGQPSASLIARFWAPRWNSVQSVNKYQREIAGVLRGGEAGKRLIEPTDSADASYFEDVPDAFEPRDGMLLIVPVYHIYGSEELSMHSPGIAELAATPYIALNERDASTFGLREGEVVELALQQDAPAILPVKIVPELPVGVAAVPVGLPGLSWDGLPAWQTPKPTEGAQ